MADELESLSLFFSIWIGFLDAVSGSDFVSRLSSLLEWKANYSVCLL